MGGDILTPCELTASVTAFANIFSSKFNNDELAVWAAIFKQLGETLETISVQRDFLDNLCKSKD